MKILFFTHIFPNQLKPNYGILVKEIAMAMSGKVDVHVIAPLPIFPLMDYFSSFSGMKKIPDEEYFGNINILRPRFLSFPKYIKWPEFFTLSRSIHKNKDKLYNIVEESDVIFTHWVFPDAHVALKLAKKFKKKTVLVIHGQKSIGFGETNLKNYFIKHTLRKVDKLLVYTEKMKEILKRDYGIPHHKMEIIFNGIDTDKFKPLNMMQQRSRLKLPKDKKIIMSLCRLSPEKGIELLIDAFRKIYKEENLYLVIVGDGPLRDKIEKKIEKHGLFDSILIVGAIPYHEVQYWYNACDLFCSPSYREEFPLNILEALCCGKPVIATPVGSSKKIINEGSNGILFPAGNSKALAQAIKWACHQKWRVKEISRFGSSFSLEKAVDNIIKNLRKTIADSIVH